MTPSQPSLRLRPPCAAVLFSIAYAAAQEAGQTTTGNAGQDAADAAPAGSLGPAAPTQPAQV